MIVEEGAKGYIRERFRCRAKDPYEPRRSQASKTPPLDLIPKTDEPVIIGSKVTEVGHEGVIKEAR